MTKAADAQTHVSTDPSISPTDPSDDIPALFATTHFRSPERPDGFTSEDLQELNELANPGRTPRPKTPSRNG
jgi:hypothetical protein